MAQHGAGGGAEGGSAKTAEAAGSQHDQVRGGGVEGFGDGGSTVEGRTRWRPPGEGGATSAMPWDSSMLASSTRAWLPSNHAQVVTWVSAIHGVRAKVLVARRAWSEPSTQRTTGWGGRAGTRRGGRGGGGAEMSHSAVLPRPRRLSSPAPRGPMASSPASVKESSTRRGSASAARCSTYTPSLVASSRRGVGGSQGCGVARSGPTGAPSGGEAAVTTMLHPGGRRWLMHRRPTSSAAEASSSPTSWWGTGVMRRSSGGVGPGGGRRRRGCDDGGLSAGGVGGHGGGVGRRSRRVGRAAVRSPGRGQCPTCRDRRQRTPGWTSWRRSAAARRRCRVGIRPTPRAGRGGRDRP